MTPERAYCHICKIPYEKEHTCPKPSVKFLHEQLYEIAERYPERFHPGWVRGVSLPRLVQALVDYAFEKAWDPHHRYCVIIRTAYKAINENKWSYEMPAYP